MGVSGRSIRQGSGTTGDSLSRSQEQFLPAGGPLRVAKNMPKGHWESQKQYQGFLRGASLREEFVLRSLSTGLLGFRERILRNKLVYALLKSSFSEILERISLK